MKKGQYREAKAEGGGTQKIHIVNVLDAETEKESIEVHERVARITKISNGNQSKYIPAKYGYGPAGPQKY